MTTEERLEKLEKELARLRGQPWLTHAKRRNRRLLAVAGLAVGVFALVCIVAGMANTAEAEEAAPNQPQTYYVIPIKGVIGRNFTAGRMRACLKEVERLKPVVVVLELDTGGGAINDAERIIDLIITHKDLRFVAFVRKALSAGATITLACEKIFVAESATIGGAVSYSVGKDGTLEQLPADVAEKFQSIWRAVCRKAAEHGGHPTLLAEAMVDPAFALTMQRTAEGFVFKRGGQGEIIKAKDRILTLTAREAVNCGLAKAMVADIRAVGEQLGFAEWTLVGGATLSTGEPGADPCESPEALYQAAYEKASTLRMLAEMTSFQEEVAFKELDDWLKKGAFVGKTVRWKMTLVETRETDSSKIIRDLERASRRLEAAQREAAQRTKVHGRGLFKGMYTARPTHPDAPKEVRHWRTVVGRLNATLRGIAAYPFEVVCRGSGESRALIGAFVSKADYDTVGKLAPEDEVEIEGCLEDVNPHIKDGAFVLVAFLERGRIIAEVEKGPQTPGRLAAEEVECKGWLSMARNYLRAGMFEKAIPYLKQVIERYGDTRYAKQARDLKQEALQMIKARSEQKDTPPTEGKAAPAR